MTAPTPTQTTQRQQSAATTSNHLTHVLNRFQPSPETIVPILAVLIGGGTGMGVVTFHYLIELVHHLTFVNLLGTLSAWGAWTLALAPTCGGLIVGLMLAKKQDFGPGLSSLIAAASAGTIRYSVLRQIQPVTKMVAAAVSSTLR